MIPQN